MDNNAICRHPKYMGKLCWISALIHPENSQAIIDGSDNIQDDIAICDQCEIFSKIAERGFGRRAADQAIMATVIKLLEQLSLKKQRLQETADQLKQSLNQLSLLKYITDTLARSDSLEKSLRIILTGATSGDAFKFNRAAVFLYNGKTGSLEGKCAIGPENFEEAGRIWEEISRIPIDRLLEEILIEDEFIPCAVETLVNKVIITASETEHPFLQTIHDLKEKLIDISVGQFTDIDFSWWPSANRIAIVPLISEGKPLGIVIADNAITNLDVTPEMLEALKSLANACAPGLQNAILHNQLYIKIKQLEHMNELIKENEAYLVRHERLADIGTLATKIAHEFRIPLVTIGGYARRLFKTFGTDKFDMKMVKVIIEEVDRLSNITSEILEYSRSSKLNIKSCNINNVVNDSLEQLKNKLSSFGVETDRKLSKKSLKIKADPERLKQVVLNIVDNAVDAMGNGGKLTVKTIQQKEYVVLEISDTGHGIDNSGLANLFNLFYTTKNRGTGLGLPVSKKIIDDHGGYINVASSRGKGSVFSIKLPAEQTSLDD